MWPYVVGLLILAAGEMSIARSRALDGPGRPADVRANGLVTYGRVLYAFPIGVFGTDHYIATATVARIVPPWMPWHLFWTYFVGAALVLGAFSLALDRWALWTARLLAGTLFAFVVLIHIPNLVRAPTDRFALAIVLRDTSFATGAVAFAVARAHDNGSRVRTLMRLALGVPTVVFGIEQILHPRFVPVIPLRLPTPAWIPAPAAIAYVTGFFMIAAGALLIVKWHARRVAACLGVFVLIVTALVYLPMVVARPGDIAMGMNFFADTLLFGAAALLLAGALPVDA